MTPEKWEEICQREPEYRKVKVRFIDGKLNLALYLCEHLGKSVGMYRRECRKGILGSDGQPGVKPCMDCGPKKCKFYLEDPDAT